MTQQIYVLNRFAMTEVNGMGYITDLAGIAVFSTLDAAKRVAQEWHSSTRDGTLTWVDSAAYNGIECECQGLLYDISLQILDQDQEEIDLQINP
jgi:hypothetical protein